MKSISGVVLKVADIKRTTDFYEALGFRTGKRGEDFASIYLNWFFVEFRQLASGEPLPANTQPYICIKVDSATEFKKFLMERKFHDHIGSENVVWEKGEFILNDPDGYQLLIFDAK